MKGFKRISGLFLFWVSWLFWGLMLIVPFILEADAATITMVTTMLLVLAEVSFFTGLFLLGKPFYQALKARLKPYWYRNKKRRVEAD